MTTSRRRFIQSASAIGALAALPGSALAQGAASKSLDILVLGGTGFIGPHEINYAKARGHNITMFNRGKTAPGMFPDVEALIGDRDDELDSLKGRDWDAVIDNSGFYPRHARLSAGNEILVPGLQDLPVQYIDAADMCGWMVRLLEDGDGSGPYNAVGAKSPYIAKPFLEGLVAGTGSKSTLTWIDWEWLRKAQPEVGGYAPWYREVRAPRGCQTYCS